MTADLSVQQLVNKQTRGENTLDLMFTSHPGHLERYQGEISPGCVSSLMERLRWEPLKDRRCKDRLTMAYKIRNRLVDIDPSNYYKPGDSRTRGGHRIHQQRTLKDQYRYSFFPRSTREWNTLPEKATTAATLEEFKASLTILPEALTGASHT
ncbi:unnamed protein product [Mytilus edulis]|uniref:Uncharacterized protein n=1 Tax=Mytilus edulis TaxID=6550 RepID=A0A8S3SIA9_MYTED|nr:unnamed protein product [Mytilus edulis]